MKRYTPILFYVAAALAATAGILSWMDGRRPQGIAGVAMAVFCVASAIRVKRSASQGRP